jgi:hypothetical protein
MGTRLTGSPNNAPIPGLYKVLCRVGVTADLTTFQIRFGQVFNLTQTSYGPTVEIVRPDMSSAFTYNVWVDLGEQAFPFGVQNIDPNDSGVATIPEVKIDAARVSGTGNLRLDAIMLIPINTVATAVDTITQTSRFHGFGIESDRNGIWDGQLQRFAAYNFATALANLRTPEIRGGWLKVVPGANNVFILLQQSRIKTPFFTTINDSDVVGNEADVTLSYLPRYLHLRPDTE